MRLLLALAGLAALLLPSTAPAQPSPSPFTSATRYDAAGRVTGTISPDPDGPTGPLLFRAVRNSYDGAGRLVLVETGVLHNWQSEAVAPGAWNGFAAFQSVAITYDAGNRKTSERLRDAATNTVLGLTQYRYDSLGRLECIAVRMNPAAYAEPPASACSLGAEGDFGPDRITHNLYDRAGQLLQVEEAYGTDDEAVVATRTYTPNGRVGTLTDGENNRTTYVYDGFDRLSRTRFPSPTQGADTSSTTDFEELTYDTNGNVINRRLRDGTSIGSSYDALNRIVTKNLPGSELDVSYGYDLLGRTTSVATSAQTLTFTFDALGRNVTQTSPQGTMTSTFDLAGRRTSLSWPGGALVVGYAYLITGEMTEIRESPSGSNTLLAGFGYDYLGRRRSLTYGDGTTASYAYDAASRLSELTHNFAGAAYDITTTFAYNPASQTITADRSNTNHSFTGRTNANVADTINGLNQTTATGNTGLTHDARGNITGIGSASYGYTSENLMTSGPGVALGYDPLLRLSEESGGAGVVRFGYDGGSASGTGDDNLVAEYDGSNSLRYMYVFGPGVNEPLAWIIPGHSIPRRFLHLDERGSQFVMTDGSGNVLFGTAYDEYGNPLSGATGTRFGYTGQPWLPQPGLYYYRARIYNPSLGRFMQTDPIGYDGGINLYAYVRDDPVNRSDPDGLIDVDLRLWRLELSLHALLIGEWTASLEAPGTSIRASVGGGNISASLDAGSTSLNASVGLNSRVSLEVPGLRSQIGRVSTLQIGPYARESIPARGPSRLNAAEQREINRIGNVHGCHTCGNPQPNTRSGNWIGDHQPPSALNSQGQSQRIYPHCLGCSNRQGGEVLREINRTDPPTHRRRVRDDD